MNGEQSKENTENINKTFSALKKFSQEFQAQAEAQSLYTGNINAN